ncbi:DUF3306 domain-containing protein [Methylobacterium marchantiae]|uniref:DUF3306 domain-containing protein n=1 Tax=Methylobacterium marchantiae TaxID=600331 RepID=A0ABW3WZH9_9HYPH|nr:hypothetical protein AIGOOFII_0714 [Methylobacterium marchantiae]
MRGGDFLSRWSKRKRALVRDTAPVAVPAEAPQVEDASPSDAVDESDLLSPEELAKLPSVDSLTAATDLTQFLRAGVPLLMRKAALRRMWSVDTDIRDYVSEAREYAYDWNAVGGVPGNGPLLPTDDIKAMLRDIFDGTPAPEDTSEPAVAEQELGEAETVTSAANEDAEANGVDPDPEFAAAQESLPNPALAEPRRSPEEATVTRPRRHGGAVPL